MTANPNRMSARYTLGSGFRRGLFLGAALLSAGIECFQVLLPSRTPALADVLANLTGFLLGSDPALTVPGVSRDEGWQTLTVTYDGEMVVVRAVWSTPSITRSVGIFPVAPSIRAKLVNRSATWAV